MTEHLFAYNAYLKESGGKVVEVTERGGIVLDRSIFYPTGGGQTGDTGRLIFEGDEVEIAATVKGEDGAIILVPAEGSVLPVVGIEITQHLDWDQRHLMMRIHTALHLLSVVIPLPVTGGNIRAEKGRLDFAMPEPLDDKQAVEDRLNALIENDFAVTESWITDAELDANPELVKTMSVQPPRGAGQIRLVRIGDAEKQVDLQPCGGTHVRSTAEIGRVRLGKVEKKGRINRRVSLFLVD